MVTKFPRAERQVSAEFTAWRASEAAKMLEDGATVILERVEKAARLLARAEEASTLAADVAALNQVLDELQQVTVGLRSQRVLELSATQLMNAGVELYNAPRAALRVLAQVEKAKQQEGGPQASFSRYSLVVTRFVAAKIMGLSLVCSKDDGKQTNGSSKNAHFMDECVDVLRSFGRVGMLMLESASADCERCEEYLAMASEAFSSSIQLWSRIGLSQLTKFKQGLELEDVVDDLWDFCLDRVRVLRLLVEQSNDASMQFQDIVSSLHELKMLAPYKASYASCLLDLMASVSDGYCKAAQHELHVAFTEEALRVSESLENGADENFVDRVAGFKQRLLLNLLQSLCAIGDIDRAEACYQLIPDNRDPKALQLMIKLQVDSKQFDKAHRLLFVLFRQDSLDDAILGARTYARGLSFSDKGLDIYRELADNYGDAIFIINLEIACNIAFEEDKRYQAMDELKRVGSTFLELERDGQVTDSMHTCIQRARQTIFDALQHALNSNQHEDALKWAEVGLSAASRAQDQAMYLRAMSRLCLQLKRDSEASDWAGKAFHIEPSKQSLFAMFQAALESKPEAPEEELVHIMDQLKARDDFELEDWLAMGKLANNLDPARQDIVMYILDELCRAQGSPPNVPKAVILQNAAQLAFNKFTQQQAEASTESQSFYGEKFLTYTSALLQTSRPGPNVNVGPSSVFEWFFRMSFDIAKSTEDARYFVVAADIAERSDELYGEHSPLKKQCQQCLLAAISSATKKIETLDKNRLGQLLEVIQRFEIIDTDTEDESDIARYLAKAVIMVKLRLFDANTKAILDLCKTKLHSASELIEIGELVLYATKFNEAAEVRDRYRALAGEIFNYGLQMLVRAGLTDASKLCYLLRRIITLADSKTKAHEWFEHLLQFVNSLDVAFSEVDLEWFVAKAWNIGVLCHRSNDTEEALKFMRTAQAVMQHSEALVGKLAHGLDEQYQALLRVGSQKN